MRFVKILLVCLGLVLLAGLGTNHGSPTVSPANRAFVVDGGETFPTPPLEADGGDPLPIPPLSADGGDPLPIPPLVTDGGDPLPIPPVVNGFAA